MQVKERTQEDVIDDLARALMKLTPVTACPISWEKKANQYLLLTELLKEFADWITQQKQLSR